MKHPNSVFFTNAQVARIEARRRALGLTMQPFVEKFALALKGLGCNQTSASAKMRLDRVLNPRMRKPVSETTKAALAQTLGWSLQEFEEIVGATREISGEPKAPRSGMAMAVASANSLSARQIALSVAADLDTYQIARGVDLSVDNVTRVYAAAYRMFQRIRALMEHLPVDDFAHDSRARRIYDALASVLNASLRPHLTEWPERYEQWSSAYRKSEAAKELSAQELQAKFPKRAELQRDLVATAKRLQTDAKRLKALARSESSDAAAA